jgi:hypothetical protein
LFASNQRYNSSFLKELKIKITTKLQSILHAPSRTEFTEPFSIPTLPPQVSLTWICFFDELENPGHSMESLEHHDKKCNAKNLWQRLGKSVAQVVCLLRQEFCFWVKVHGQSVCALSQIIT